MGALHKQVAYGAGYNLRAQLTACDLEALARQAGPRPVNLAGLAQRNRRQYPVPAYAPGAPLLIDEGLRLPVVLDTALRTAALYQRMDWSVPYTRRYVAVEFFRQYSQLLISSSLKLLGRGVSLDLALANLLVTVSNGAPGSIQLRRVGGFTCQIPEAGPEFTPALSMTALYSRFVEDLLERNLRPMIERLVELSGARPEVFWDYAIEALLAALPGLATGDEALERLRDSLFVHELSHGRGANLPVALPIAGQPHNRPVMYLKRRCCEKYRKDKRCSSCPGLKKLPA